MPIRNSTGFHYARASCASPGLFFEVSPTQGISDAMNTLFKKAVADARIAS